MARYCEHNREINSIGNVDCPWCIINDLQAELEALKEENKVLKLTIEHYKSDKNVKF